MKMKQWKRAGIWTCILLMAMTAPGAAIAAQAAGSSAEPNVSSEKMKVQVPFMIKVVDAETGRGIPHVQLKTTNSVLYYTDSAGIVAFDEPGLMDQTVFFHISSDGYDIPADMFGNRGAGCRG